MLFGKKWGGILDFLEKWGGICPPTYNGCDATVNRSWQVALSRLKVYQ